MAKKPAPIRQHKLLAMGRRVNVGSNVVKIPGKGK